MGENIALGFCNNVDYEIVWSREVVEQLVLHYRIRADELGKGGAIESERDLLLSILGFMSRGEGGERFVSDSAIIERFATRFRKTCNARGNFGARCHRDAEIGSYLGAASDHAE